MLSLNSDFLKKSLILRISVVFSIIVASVFVGFLILIVRHEQQNTAEVSKSFILKQAELIFRSNEQMRIENNLKNLAHSVWGVEGVGAVAFFDNNCRNLYSIPSNYSPTPNCTDFEKETLVLPDISDRFTNIQSIYLRPAHTSSMFSKIDLWSIFFIFFSALVVSIVLGTYIFQKGIVVPMSQIVEKLKNFEKWGDDDNELPSEFWEIESALTNTKTRLQEAEKQKIKMAQNEVMVKAAQQVAHDIRSPISALNALKNANISDDKAKAILDKVIQRVQGIAEGLLQNSKRDSSSPVSIGKLAKALTELITEKRLLSQNCTILLEENVHTNHYLQLELPTLITGFSNLLDNSLQAGATEITLSITNNDKNLEIQLKDNGSGIPKDILEKLGTTKVTSKEEGNGVGVLSTVENIQSWGGSTKIESTEGIGVELTITLPLYKKTTQ